MTQQQEQLSRLLMRLPIDHWAFSFRLAATVAVLGLISFMLLPRHTSIALIREGGIIENATIVFYYLALAVLWLGTPPGLDRSSRIAMSILLLACVARELDLHSAWFGMSILKMNFYRRFATGPQIAVALLMMLPILLSIGFLLMRHRRWLLDGMRLRRPAPITTLSIFFMLVLVKILDRSLAIAKSFGMYDAPLLFARTIQISLEEPLEMILPLLVIVAIVQQWRSGQ